MDRKDWPQDFPKKPVQQKWIIDRPAAHAGRQPWPKRDTWFKRRERREGNSNAHLALIRKLWCTLGVERTWMEPIQPHHLLHGPAKRERGIGMKSSDRWVVPLVWWRHEEVHHLGSKHEALYFLEEGINPYALATALWNNTGDLVRMGRVLTAHQMQATARKLNRNELGALILDLPPDQWARI